MTRRRRVHLRLLVDDGDMGTGYSSDKGCGQPSTSTGSGAGLPIRKSQPTHRTKVHMSKRGALPQILIFRASTFIIWAIPVIEGFSGKCINSSGFLLCILWFSIVFAFHYNW